MKKDRLTMPRVVVIRTGTSGKIMRYLRRAYNDEMDMITLKDEVQYYLDEHIEARHPVGLDTVTLQYDSDTAITLYNTPNSHCNVQIVDVYARRCNA